MKLKVAQSFYKELIKSNLWYLSTCKTFLEFYMKIMILIQT